MRKLTLPVEVLLLSLAFSLGNPLPATAGEFESLRPDQKIASFQVEAVYENEGGKAMGARFRHEPTRYVLDVLRIQSIPQAFMWVNSPPPSDQGEPHTLEHLLLGKGTKGRYVASLEQMSLGRSSAFTQQRRTCYHFSTEAGKDVFFELYEAKLDAMLNPNFSDEEIRREVCHVGIIEKDEGKPWLEEKGTVYNEMVSSFERPWGNLYYALEEMLYGPGHVLSMSSGGLPAAIREMKPKHIRDFHADTHHLNNMGAVVSIGDEITVEECLGRLSDIFDRVEPGAVAGEDPAALWDRLPGPRSAPAGEIRLTHFPHQNDKEPGLMVMAWPPTRVMDTAETHLLELFMSLMASGQTSNLYRKFIDSQTREMDIGASSVFTWVDDQPGRAVFVGFNSVDPSACDEASLKRIRSLVLNEIRSAAALPDGSDELAEFNRRALNQVMKNRRDLRVFLNSPPRFGYRGTGSSWLDHLQVLHRKGGFRRNLAAVDELAAAEKLLARKDNFWAALIEKWGLLDEPYAAATTGNPPLLETAEKEREARIAGYVGVYQARFETPSVDETLARFKEAYDRDTEIIDAEAAAITMPQFVDKPPLSLDDQLRFQVKALSGGGSLVTSTFENITSGTVGLAFNLNVIPEERLVYIPALPTLLRNVGVIHDGTPVTYDAFDEMLRKEILSLDVYFSGNYRTERAELAVRGSGSEQSETVRALEWMKVVLFHPDLRLENLPRIRDAVDLSLKGARNRMRGREESWVNTPVYSYWKQHNPVLMQTHSFLTQTHSLHRLRWMLKDADGGMKALRDFGEAVVEKAEASGRDTLGELLTAVVEGEKNEMVDLDSMNEASRQLVRDAAEDFRSSLAEIPDGSLVQDLRYLGRQMAADLEVVPEDALKEIQEVLDTIRHRDNVRGFMVANTQDQAAGMPHIDSIVAGLAETASVRQSYPGTPLVASRVADRGGDRGSIYVALVNESTRSGVHVHTSDCASYLDTDRETLLRFLSARLYGGGGAHSMFMKTWGAGLAYSNGLRSNENLGRLIYYAERCPDLAQTLQFVIDELENAPFDESLADYAVAQAFSGNRSGSRYEQRGEAMAADLADGVTSEVIAAFRQGVLDLRREPELYKELHERMQTTYGEVLPGYGRSGDEAASKSNAIYFVIGPEKQLQSWESYLKSVEPGSGLTRIYPRDYWRPRSEKGL